MAGCGRNNDKILEYCARESGTLFIVQIYIQFGVENDGSSVTLQSIVRFTRKTQRKGVYMLLVFIILSICICNTAIVGPRLIHTITNDDKINGVALLNNELYVLRCRSDNQIDVYSTINFTLLRQLSVDSENSLTGIAACPQKRAIYVINEVGYGVHRLGPDGSECKWPLTYSPLSLSVTRTSDVLVLCTVTIGNSEVNKVLFLNSENGECVRTITAQISADFEVYHCVQLKDDRYLMSYCSDARHDNGIVIRFDGDGKVLQSTQGEVSMHYPTFVTVDSDQFVLVCNYGARRVDLFDPMLNYVCNLTEGISVNPWSFVFDEFTRRLYIDDHYPYFHHVSIVQL